MPVIFRYKGYRFFFFSNEGDPREPMHVHVRKGEATAKLWIDPTVAVAEAYRMDASELRELAKVVEENRNVIERSWNEHFPE
jgi:hypothetical protein